MPWCAVQVVGIPYDCSATGWLALEAHVYEPQRDRMEPFRASRMIVQIENKTRQRWRRGKKYWLTTDRTLRNSWNHSTGTLSPTLASGLPYVLHAAGGCFALYSLANDSIFISWCYQCIIPKSGSTNRSGINKYHGASSLRRFQRVVHVHVMSIIIIISKS